MLVAHSCQTTWWLLKSHCILYPHLGWFWGFSSGSNGKESACNAGDPGSIPGLGRSPWRREWLLIPVFLPGEFHGQRSHEVTKSRDMTEWLTHTPTHVYHCFCLPKTSGSNTVLLILGSIFPHFHLFLHSSNYHLSVDWALGPSRLKGVFSWD